MRKIVFLGMAILFISMLFILLIFTSIAATLQACSSGTCSDSYMYFTVLNSYIFAVIFLAIDVITGYLIIREKPWQGDEPRRKGSELARLKEEKLDTENARQEAEDQFYKGKFDEQTFKHMLEKYDEKLVDIGTKIKG